MRLLHPPFYMVYSELSPLGHLVATGQIVGSMRGGVMVDHHWMLHICQVVCTAFQCACLFIVGYSCICCLYEAPPSVSHGLSPSAKG